MTPIRAFIALFDVVVAFVAIGLALINALKGEQELFLLWLIFSSLVILNAKVKS